MAKVEQTLVEHPVDIVTAFAPGPRAVPYAPPGYDAERPLTDQEFGLIAYFGSGNLLSHSSIQ